MCNHLPVAQAVLALRREWHKKRGETMNQQRVSETKENQLEKFILIVEDDINNADIIELALTSLTPYQVQSVSNAETALQLISERKPDLLLLDEQLPGMTGLELYDYLHTIPEFSTVPALLLSASPYSIGEVEGHHMTFLSKPYELETLLEVIHRLLD